MSEKFDFEMNRVVTLRHAAAMLGVSDRTLRRQAGKGTGPRLIRLSERRIGIRVKDLNEWMDASTTH